MCLIGIRNKLVLEVLYYEKRMILCQNMYKHNEIMIFQAMVELPDCGCATNRGVLTVCMMTSFMSDISDCISSITLCNSSIFFLLVAD